MADEPSSDADFSPTTNAGTATILDETTDTYGLVTVSGPPGCGATTVAEHLSEALGYTFVNGGAMFRELAEERGLSLNQLIADAESEDTLDRSLDARLQRIIDQHDFTTTGLVIESRLAGWLAGEKATFRLWLDAPIEARKERVTSREEDPAEMQVREVSEEHRYSSYYDIDLDDRSLYDLQINTARWSPDAVMEVIMTALTKYSPTADEGAFGGEINPESPH